MILIFTCSCGYSAGNEANVMELKSGLCKLCRYRIGFTDCLTCCYASVPKGGKGKKDCQYCNRDLGEPVAATKPVYATIVAAPSLLPEDWRIWRDHNRPAGHCPCGVSKTVCDYHREGA